MSDFKERPIPLYAHEVRGILDGRQTQVRRVVKPQPHAGIRRSPFAKSGLEDGHGREIRAVYGQPGDRLWLRETWQYADWTDEGEPYIGYAADNARQLCANSPIEWADRLTDTWATLSDPANYEIDNCAADRCWRPSIHMPRWASRITLEITSVRVERLNDISEKDALEEGITYYDIPNNGLDPMRARTWFRGLWESINGPGSWDANPWVWVIEFRRVEQ